MKKIIIAITLLVALLISGCTKSNGETKEDDNSQNGIGAQKSIKYRTFEETLKESTDVVAAKYVGSKPFGNTLTELEFTVTERIFGNAPNTIYVYVSNSGVSVLGKNISSYKEDDVSYKKGVEYLLMLKKITFAECKTHDDGYTFFNSSIVNLSEPSKSTMYNQSLNLHSDGLSLNSKTSMEEIVSYARELTKSNIPVRDFIRSDKLEDIIGGSPYILTVEIGELYQKSRSDWTENDQYYVTVITALKGEVKSGKKFVIPFFPDTVKTGEQYIVAVDPDSVEYSFFWGLSSKNSLFELNKFSEITSLINADK